MELELTVGAAKVDITPPVGTLLAGALRPRESQGVGSRLYASALVIEDEWGSRLALVALDLISVDRGNAGDAAVRLASQATGIPESHICLACSHTHTGPYTRERQGEFLNPEWLDGLPGKISQAVAEADRARVPATMSRCRAFEFRVQHNRRMRFKDGRDVNAWLLKNQVNTDLQCLGSAGPIDPEIGMLAFEDAEGELIAVVYTFALHSTSDFGTLLSADYPGVVADRLADAFGAQTVPLYLAGCCGNINPNTGGGGLVETGNRLADAMIPALESRSPVQEPVVVDARKRAVAVPLRDLNVDQEERLEKCGWDPGSNQFFREGQARLRAEGIAQVETVVQALRIGDTGLIALPGEVFVEWGLHVKRQGPFGWNYGIALSNDSLGYLITRDAWEAGGYEALTSAGTFIDVAGVELMVGRSMAMLRQLHGDGPASPARPD